MSVLVRNELDDPWIFEGSRGSRQLAAAEVALISDEEWESIITAKRGPGGIHALSSDPGSRSKSQFDYLIYNSAAQVQYLGQAAQAVLDTDPLWTIKKFTYTTAADSTTQVASVEVFDSVAWVDRASLPWT